MNHAVYSVSRPQSQSERSYLPGSPEKETLKKELKKVLGIKEAGIWLAE